MSTTMSTLPTINTRKATITEHHLREKAYKFIKAHRAGALATADLDGTPHVAIVYGLVKEDLSIYFSTRVEGRKFHNLVARPDVSFTFFDEINMVTIQLTGKAERVKDLSAEQDVLFELITLRYGEPNWQAPPMKMFERGATNELAIIKVTPFEMTYASFDVSDTGRYKPFFEKVV